MAISDDLVAALRAQLAGDPEVHDRLWARLDQQETRTGYPALVEGAFFEAVDRRLDKETRRSQVVQLVGEIRSRSAEIAERLDPSTAEHLVLAVLGHETLDGIDNAVRFRTESVLLAALIHDEQLDDVGLDAFMAKARDLGDYLLG